MEYIFFNIEIVPKPEFEPSSGDIAIIIIYGIGIWLTVYLSHKYLNSKPQRNRYIYMKIEEFYPSNLKSLWLYDYSDFSCTNLQSFFNFPKISMGRAGDICLIGSDSLRNSNLFGLFVTHPPGRYPWNIWSLVLKPHLKLVKWNLRDDATNKYAIIESTIGPEKYFVTYRNNCHFETNMFGTEFIVKYKERDFF